MSKKFKKKKPINIEAYNNLMKKNKIFNDCLEILKSKIQFPIKSLLEIGTGTGQFLTKYLIENERGKNIEKFYGMEPIDELFEESKKHVVRLSRTDATAQEYFGGNPFDVIVFALVFSHITDDKKRSFIKNLYGNLKEGGKLIFFDAFIPEYSNQEDKEVAIHEFIQANIECFKACNNIEQANYFQSLLNSNNDDYIIGEYKSSLDNLIKLLENIGFINIHVEKYSDSRAEKWAIPGYYIISADKE